MLPRTRDDPTSERPARPRPRTAAVRRAGIGALVAAATAASLAAVVVAHGDDRGAATVLGVLLVGFLVPLAAIDARERRLPDRLVYPAGVAALVAGVVLDPAGEPERLAAGAAAGACFLLVALVRPDGLGLGDVKLAAVLGLYLGAEVAVAIFVALLSGSAVGLGVLAVRGVAEGRRTALAFGPFLALGGLVAVIAGPALLRAYLAGP